MANYILKLVCWQASVLCGGLVNQLAKKWPVLELMALETDNYHFNALKRKIRDINPKALTETLRELERNGLVSRKLSLGSVVYSITPLGAPLARMMGYVGASGTANIRKVELARAKYKAPPPKRAVNRAWFVEGSNSCEGGSMTRKTTNKCAPEVRHRAVRTWR